MTSSGLALPASYSYHLVVLSVFISMLAASAALPYLRVGLARAEKCLYVADENSVANSWMLCAEARLASIITCAGT
jgi:hypothetical protein